MKFHDGLYLQHMDKENYMFNPEHISRIELLDKLFAGSLPLIREPVEFTLTATGDSLEEMGELLATILMADNDHLLCETMGEYHYKE